MPFTAIDFETANYQNTSACSIGVAHFDEAGLVKTEHFYIKPEPDYFDWRFTQLHGIGPAEVQDAPVFGDLWPSISQALEGKTLLAHNAQFDMPLLHRLLRMYGISTTEMPFACSYRLAVAQYGKRVRCGLGHLAERFGIELIHHNAASDAQACGMIALRLMQEAGVTSLEELARHHRYNLGKVDEQGCRSFLKDRSR